MPQISYINYTDIQKAGRYDAEYFKPEYLETLKIIKKYKCLFISEIALIKSGTTPKIRDENLKEGVILLKTGNIRNNTLQYDQQNYFHIDSLTNKKMKSSELKNGDVLLNIVGATTSVIGRTALVTSDFPKSNITQAMASCRIFSLEINPSYLFLFFQTVYGMSQTKRLARPTGQFNLNLDEVGRYIIPILPASFQLEIEEIVKSAHQKQSASKQLYKEAEELLLTELSLINYKVKHKLTFTTTKNEIKQASRYDSEYFQPKYDQIIEKIESYEGGFDWLGNMVDWKKGIEVGAEAYCDTGKDFIRVSDVTVFGLSDANKKISNEVFEDLKKKYQPKKDEILFTKDGTIGISYLLKEDSESIVSGAFLRLTLQEKYKNFEKECLTLIFNSIICKMQVQKLSGGALIAHLKPSDLETFRIPLINQLIQEQIATKIQESHKLRKESKELLETAKRMVEQEIEK